MREIAGEEERKEEEGKAERGKKEGGGVRRESTEKNKSGGMGGQQEWVVQWKSGMFERWTKYTFENRNGGDV